MQLKGRAVRVIIYIGESDRHQGKSLHMALLEFLKREGAAGATVLRGLAGFGAHSRIHTASVLTLSEDLPLRLEWVDQAQVVERLLPQVRKMVDDGLITVEKVDVVQYAPGRQVDPLALPVQDVMQTEVITVSPDMPAADVAALLVQRGTRSLPVVDQERRLLGLITDGDLLRRTGLLARPAQQAPLPSGEWQKQLAALRRREETAADIMTRAVLTLSTTDSLRHAMSQMAQNHLKRLPVIDNSGRLAGWISRVDVLHTLEYHRPLPPREREPLPVGQSVADLMVRTVAAVPPDANVEQILRALEKNRQRRAVVVDARRHVLGIITDGDLLRRIHPQLQSGVLTRLRALFSGRRPPSATLPSAAETAASLMTAPAVTISQGAPLADALRLMTRHQIKRLPVVDERGCLVGLLGRASLLSGLLAAAPKTTN